MIILICFLPGPFLEKLEAEQNRTNKRRKMWRRVTFGPTWTQQARPQASHEGRYFAPWRHFTEIIFWKSFPLKFYRRVEGIKDLEFLGLTLRQFIIKISSRCKPFFSQSQVGLFAKWLSLSSAPPQDWEVHLCLFLNPTLPEFLPLFRSFPLLLVSAWPLGWV